MAAAERRKRRVLQNSEERFQKIRGLRSQHSSNDSSVPEGELPYKTEKGRDADASVGPNDVDEAVDTTRAWSDQEVNQDCDEQEQSARSLSGDSEQPQPPVAAEPPNRWIRPIANALLAVLLLARWAYLNFDSLSTHAALKSNSGQGDDQREQTRELANESIIWPFVALQLALLCVPQFRQTMHSPRISVWTLALQLSGVSVHLTKLLSLVVSSVLAALSDWCFFLFAVVLLHELIIAIMPLL